MGLETFGSGFAAVSGVGEVAALEGWGLAGSEGGDVFIVVCSVKPGVVDEFTPTTAANPKIKMAENAKQMPSKNLLLIKFSGKNTSLFDKSKAGL